MVTQVFKNNKLYNKKLNLNLIMNYNSDLTSGAIGDFIDYTWQIGAPYRATPVSVTNTLFLKHEAQVAYVQLDRIVPVSFRKNHVRNRIEPFGLVVFQYDYDGISANSKHLVGVPVEPSSTGSLDALLSPFAATRKISYEILSFEGENITANPAQLN